MWIVVEWDGMSTAPLHVVVLDHDAHGIPAADYAAILREQLPEHTVTLARTPSERREAVADAEIVAGKHVPDGLLDEGMRRQRRREWRRFQSFAELAGIVAFVGVFITEKVMIRGLTLPFTKRASQ